MPKLKYCKSYILPNTRPNLHINDQGNCNGYASRDSKDKKIINFVEMDFKIYDYVNKNTIKELINNKDLLNYNTCGKFLFSFLSLKLFMERFN